MVNKNQTEALIKFDNEVVRIMKKHGKKTKKYQLINNLKKEVACSELEVKLSLERLLNKGKIKHSENSYYILSEYL